MVLECSAIHAGLEEIFNSLEAIRFCPLTLFISENFIIGLLYPAVPSLYQQNSTLLMKVIKLI